MQVVAEKRRPQSIMCLMLMSDQQGHIFLPWIVTNVH